jgi:hypothetical protein
MIAHGVELLVFKEAAPHVVLPQHGEVRFRVQLAGLHGQREHPFEAGELAVDGRWFGAGLLATHNVRSNQRRRDRKQPLTGKGRFQV